MRWTGWCRGGFWHMLSDTTVRLDMAHAKASRRECAGASGDLSECLAGMISDGIDACADSNVDAPESLLLASDQQQMCARCIWGALAQRDGQAMLTRNEVVFRSDLPTAGADGRYFDRSTAGGGRRWQLKGGRGADR